MRSCVIQRLWILLLACAFAGALLLRLPQLDRRPMHNDEANQAVRFGMLLTTGEYKYDRKEHHGPSLYYLTLPLAWLTAGEDFGKVTERTLRLVPVLFGVGLIPLLCLMRSGLGRPATLVAAALTAVSPAMVFYSRYYVQESLLVFFSYAMILSGWRHVRSERLAWVLAAGSAAGLMHATKETCVIAYACMAGAWVLASRRPAEGDPRITEKHHAPGVAAAVFVSALLFSSFLTHGRGPLDSLRAYLGYFGRGGGLNTDHVHPWHYYLHMIFGIRYPGGPFWSEALIPALAIVGCLVSLRKPSKPEGDWRLKRFLAVYALLMTVAYSAIPYKTPWCLLSFLHAMILLAGVGAAFLWAAIRPRAGRALLVLLLAAGIAHLTAQSIRANFSFYRADPRNPYVYGHTSSDFLNLVRRIEAMAAIAPEGRSLPVRVITSTQDAWPLPWYLRAFPQVGYWPRLEDVPLSPPPSLIVTSPAFEEELAALLPVAYTSEHYGLRPGALLTLYVRQDLWDAFLRNAEQRPAGTRR